MRVSVCLCACARVRACACVRACCVVRQDAAYVVGFPPDAVALAPVSELFSASCAEAKPEYFGAIEVQLTGPQSPPCSSSYRPTMKRRRTDTLESEALAGPAPKREVGTAKPEAAEASEGIDVVHAADWRCDGWLGYFTSTLWDGIVVDSRHCQTTRNSFHWEAFFFPLREPIHVPWVGSTQQQSGTSAPLGTQAGSNCLHFRLRRCCKAVSAPSTAGAGDGEQSCYKLWYEWASRPARVADQPGQWHNVDGESQALSLQSPEQRQADGARPPPLDTPVTDPLETEGAVNK